MCCYLKLYISAVTVVAAFCICCGLVEQLYCTFCGLRSASVVPNSYIFCGLKAVPVVAVLCTCYGLIAPSVEFHYCVYCGFIYKSVVASQLYLTRLLCCICFDLMLSLLWLRCICYGFIAVSAVSSWMYEYLMTLFQNMLWFYHCIC